MRGGLAIGIVALLALAGGGATLHFWRENDRALARVGQLETELKQARSETVEANARLESLNSRAIELDTALGTAKTHRTASESRAQQLSHELTETKASLAERQQREASLLADIQTLRQKIAAGQNTPGMTEASSRAPSAPVATSSEAPVDVSLYEQKIAELEDQLTQHLLRALETPGGSAASAAPSPSPAPAAGFRILRVGPDAAFLVVDCGSATAARVGSGALVLREGREIARLELSDVRERLSIAQVMPGSLKGQLQPGDLVVLTQ